MASNDPAATVPAAKEKPLAMMTKLSQYVYVYEPSSSCPAEEEASSPAAAPKVVLLCSWYDAANVHIAKYVAHYRAMFPSAKILLVKIQGSMLFYPSMQWEAAGPAVDWLAALVRKGELSPGVLASSADAAGEEGGGDGGDGKRPQILAHMFSNGGVTSLQNVARRFHADMSSSSSSSSSSSGDGKIYLPPHAAVFDSCPGHWAFWNSYNAFIVGFKPGTLSRLVASPLVAGFVGVMYLLWKTPVRDYLVPGREDLMTRNFRLVNQGFGDTEGLEGKANRDVYETDGACGIALRKTGGEPGQTRRAYIYGEGDTMVEWQDVEDNARVAAEKLGAAIGGDVGARVRVEKFEGSAHVSHMRSDPTRYWEIVRDTWEGVDK